MIKRVVMVGVRVRVIVESPEQAQASIAAAVV